MRPIAGVVLALLLLSSTRASATAPPATWEGGYAQPPAAAPPQGPPPAPYPYGAQPYGAQPYGAQPYGAGPYINPQSLYLYENEKKTPAIAVLLSLLVPGVGNLYADHIAGAAITWALIIGGAVVAVNGVHTTTDSSGFVTNTQYNSGEITLGVLMFVSGIIYSPIDAYVSSVDYNRALAQRLRLPTGFVLAPAPIRTERGVAWGPGLSLRF
jgi:TM2 domain-containing membrane protein YozV